MSDCSEVITLIDTQTVMTKDEKSWTPCRSNLKDIQRQKKKGENVLAGLRSMAKYLESTFADLKR